MNANATSAAAPIDRAPERPVLQEGRGYFTAGSGAPVVMLHSSLASKSQWKALAERMASRFRVIALDLRGYGDNTAATGSAFALDEEVRLVTDHLDRLVEPHLRIHVVGHSYGGLVALRFAHRWRGRVASLSLYEPVAFRILDDDDAAMTAIRRLVERLGRLIAAGRRLDATQAFMDFWGGEGSYASLPPAARDRLSRRIDKLPFDFQAAGRWPARPSDLRAIVAPTLLLAGRRSPAVVQRIASTLSRILPNRRIGWFDFGHMGPITHADRVNPWIEAFVDLCAGSARRPRGRALPALNPVR
jgi:pimeloyl-ACP methyl ester carboxylesterase